MRDLPANTPEIIARVADAILDKMPFGYGMTGAEAVEYARAAIAAMREPTPDMTYVGLTFASGDTVGDREDSAAEIWRSMIDTALTALTAPASEL